MSTSPLRRVLAEVVSAGGGASLAEIAGRIGVGVDEARSMVDFWVRRGRLSVDEITGCAFGSCASCRLRVRADAGPDAAGTDAGRTGGAAGSAQSRCGGDRRPGPVLLTIRPAERPAASERSAARGRPAERSTARE